MMDSKQPPNPQAFTASLDPEKWVPAIIPLERLDIEKYSHEVERKVKRSKSLNMKLRWLRYHIEDLSKVLDMSRSRARKLEDEGKVDKPESYGDYHEELANVLRDFRLKEEALLIEMEAAGQQGIEKKANQKPSNKQVVQFGSVVPLNEYMFIEEAADYLKIKLSTFRQICARGEIDCSKAGKRLRFRKTALDQYATEKENERKGKLKH
jgi:excisionase family DNA binding protein